METRAAAKLRVLGLLLAIGISCNCQAAQAMLLSGQVEERAESLEAPSPMPPALNQNQNQSQSQNQNRNQNLPLPLQSQQARPDTARAAIGRPAAPLATGKPTTNSFPATYQGAWYCETTVIDSTLPAVLQGQVIGSEVVFFPSKDGGIHARWNQPGWVETQSQAITFNGTEAKADRTTYYFGDNMQGSWAARARDQFAQTGPDMISAKSYVDQYLDGQYLGRYRTVSVLKRSGTPQNMASMN
ncbi:MAG: hypothetical protein WCT03_06540, partial [Candidatus Obscuribacterales bacterium]